MHGLMDDSFSLFNNLIGHSLFKNCQKKKKESG